MFIHSSRLIITHLFFLLFISTETVFASQQTRIDPEAAPAKTDNKKKIERNPLSTVKGMIMLDYEVIPVAGNESIDLLGIHYLHQVNHWLYLGLGLHAPLIHGNYGGFMAFDGTIHAQRKIFKNIFVNAGASFGGGGGGSSIQQSKELTGTGGFIKSYIGLGYEFRNFSAGVNYANFKFMNSQIDHSQLNFHIQKPFSYSNGSYAYSGRKIESNRSFPDAGINILTLELNNLFRINPQGSNKNTINALSLQFSHFLSTNHYMFVGLDVGYKGLPIYNQASGGVGYRFSVSPRVNLYSQLGIASGGYSPEQIETGPGLLVQPKFSIEYLLSNNLGLSLSSGYLVAPKGTSKNFTVGAAINYYLSNKQKSILRSRAAHDLVYRGFRFNIFHQTQYNVNVGDRKRNNIKLLSAQFDYLINDNWYIPTQASVAYNDYLGLPGYGEILAGLGIQNKFSSANRFQNFFQVLIGTNVHGALLKPSIGVNYSLSDNLALYGQIAKTISLDGINLYPDRYRFSSYSIGLGLTYRFSLP